MRQLLTLFAAITAASFSGCETYEVNSRDEIESRMQVYRSQGYSAREAYALSLRDTVESRQRIPFDQSTMIGGYGVGVNSDLLH